MIGYPDRAARLCDATNAGGRLSGHPFNQGFALTEGSEVYLLRGEPQTFKRLAEECEAIGRENSLPLLWGFTAATYAGMADIMNVIAYLSWQESCGTTATSKTTDRPKRADICSELTALDPAMSGISNSGPDLRGRGNPA
jgi:hypothetical protein